MTTPPPTDLPPGEQKTAANSSTGASTTTGMMLGNWKRLLGEQVIAQLLFAGALAAAVLFGYRAMAQEARDAGIQVAKVALDEQARMKAAFDKKTADDDSLHRRQAEDQTLTNRRIENVERVTMNIDVNLRLFMESKGITPVKLDRDGGL